MHSPGQKFARSKTAMMTSDTIFPKKSYVLVANGKFTKGHFTKEALYQGGGLKNLSGLFTGEGMPRFKKFGCFENRRV